MYNRRWSTEGTAVGGVRRYSRVCTAGLGLFVGVQQGCTAGYGCTAVYGRDCTAGLGLYGSVQQSLYGGIAGTQVRARGVPAPSEAVAEGLRRALVVVMRLREPHLAREAHRSPADGAKKD